jgi:DNA-binding beta-propeller fold protein YncE
MNVVGARLAGFQMCALAVLAICASACNLDNPGFTPPRGRITYPIAVALSSETSANGAPRYLFVANSNFDLRYNAGSVHTYDLEALQAALAEHDCRALPEDTEPDAGDELDAGEPDAGDELDAGDLDAGDLDAGDLDAGDLDAGDLDAGDLDAGDLDAGDLDADELDADELDADELDADEELDADGAPDAGELDAGEDPDGAALPDAGAGDAWLPQWEPDAQLAAGRDSVRGTLCDGRKTNPEDESACCFGAPSALDKLRTSEVLIDSYASGLALSPDDKHLYVPIRGQTRLVYLDVEDGGRLTCDNERGRCERGPRLGAVGEVEDSVFAPQPTAIVTGTLGELGTDADGRAPQGYVATAHERGSVSLFGTGALGPNASGKPELLDSFATGAQRIVSLTKDPNGLLMLSAASSSVVLRVGARRPAELDGSVPESAPAEAKQLHLYQVTSVGFSGGSQWGDIRDLLVDPRYGRDGRPERLIALVRGSGSPAPNLIQSVAFLELPSDEPDGRFAHVIDLVRVGSGPSKLEQVDLGQRHLVFASCYDEGTIYVIDADTRQIVTVIREVSGPFDMQIDARRQLLYVADFRASVLRVIDLRGLVDRNAPLPRIVATLGAPSF